MSKVCPHQVKANAKVRKVKAQWEDNKGNYGKNF